MENRTDLRCYVSPEYKLKIRQYALQNHISVNQLLTNLLYSFIPNESPDLQEELDEILRRLSNSADMPKEEREKLKSRKAEIKKILKGDQI